MLIVNIQPYYDPEIMYQESALPIAQSRLGHEVIIVTSNKKVTNRSLNHQKKMKLGIEIDKKNNLIIQRFKPRINISNHSMPLLTGISKFLEYVSPNLIIVQSVSNPSLILPAVKFCKKNQIPLFLISHLGNHNTSINKSFFVKSCYLGLKKYYKYFGKSISKFLAIAEEELIFTKKIFDLDDKKIDILGIGGWTKGDEYVSKNRLKWRSKFGISKNDFLFGHVSRINRTKGVIKTLKIFSQIRNENLKFLLLGPIEKEFHNGYDLSYEINKISQKDERIIVVDRFVENNELMKMSSAIDCGVYYGGVTIAAREIMSLGIPIVVKHLLDWDKAYQKGAVRVAENDYELEKIMMLLSSNSKEYELLKSKTKDFSKKYYDWMTITKKFINSVNNEQ